MDKHSVVQKKAPIKPLKYIVIRFDTGMAKIVRNIDDIPDSYDIIEGPEEENLQILKDHGVVEGSWFVMRLRMLRGLLQLFS